MRASLIVAIPLLGVLMGSCQQADEVRPGEIIALERGALDRWIKGDPQGFIEIMDADETYFDPNLDHRVDGLAAMKKLLEPITGKIKIDRYEMIGPKVQRYGDVAVLTFNLANYMRQPDGRESVLNRWNSTEVYRRVDGAWKLAHSHWSYVKPQPPIPAGE